MSKTAHPRKKRNSERMPFGVYRPLSAESHDLLEPAVANATDRLRTYLVQTRKIDDVPGLTANESFGVTHIEKRSIDHDMSQGNLPSFLGRKAVGLWKDNEHLGGASTLDVRLEIFSTLGSHALIYFLDEEALAALKPEAGAVANWLRNLRHEGRNITRHPTIPDHLTVARQSNRGEYAGVELISREEENVAAEIFQQEISEAGSAVVTFDPPIIGRNYESPLPIFEKIMVEQH